MTKTALFLGAHPDDIEYGCAGTLLKLMEQDYQTIYQIFTLCDNIEGNELILKEWRDATALLTPTWTFYQNYGNTELYKSNHKIRHILEDLRDKHSPSLIFTHPLHDIHQDHSTVAQETLRVFKTQSILCYPTPKSTPRFTPNCYSLLSGEEYLRKREILDCYVSQHTRNKYPYTPTYYEYEPFEVIRWIL